VLARVLAFGCLDRKFFNYFSQPCVNTLHIYRTRAIRSYRRKARIKRNEQINSQRFDNHRHRLFKHLQESWIQHLRSLRTQRVIQHESQRRGNLEQRRKANRWNYSVFTHRQEIHGSRPHHFILRSQGARLSPRDTIKEVKSLARSRGLYFRESPSGSLYIHNSRGEEWRVADHDLNFDHANKWTNTQIIVTPFNVNLTPESILKTISNGLIDWYEVAP